MPERTASIDVIVEDMNEITDGEDALYDALRELQNHRHTDDRDNLLKAETKIKQAFITVHDVIEDTAPEPNQ